MSTREIVNFGGNLRFTPAEVAAPASEAEVLAVLDRNRGRRIRVIGRLHSWSDAPRGEEVVLDLSRLNQVTLEERGGQPWVTVGAGCPIHVLLSELDRSGLTLPSVGLITEQSIAGAVATGTHGSGRECLSHFIQEFRIARYEPATGAPHIVTIDSGRELAAARCSLGCLGVVLSVGLPVRPQYRVEEHFRKYADLATALEQESDYPLQQVFYVPWLDRVFAQHRLETAAPRGGGARLYRLYWSLVFDWLFHLIVLVLARVATWSGLTRVFFRWILPATLVRGWKVVDRSYDMLTMEHELFRHIEIEVFVRRGVVVPALDFARALLRLAAGQGDRLTYAEREQLAAGGIDGASRGELAGTYTHHYPVCIRRVVADETLLSMSSGGGEDWYALSFICYARPTERAGFFRFANLLARGMAERFGGRPHWGKYSPRPACELQPLYPRLAEFTQIAQAADPVGQFRNDWLQEVLRIPPAGESPAADRRSAGEHPGGARPV